MTSGSRISRLLATATAFLGLSLLAVGVVTAQTGDVDVTVTASTLAITITDGSVAFGGRELNTTVDTVTNAPTQGQTVNNTGGITVGSLVAKYDTAIEADCGGANWDAHPSSAGVDQFALRVDDDGQFGIGDISVPVNPTASNNILATPINGGLNREIDFQLVMPTSVTTQNVVCTIALTFTASA